MSRFLYVAKESVEKWSTEFDNGVRVFATEKPVPLCEWTKGYQWARKNIDLLSVGLDDFDVFYTPAGETGKISQQDIDDAVKMRYTTFDQYVRRGLKIWSTRIPKDSENWMKGSCNCPHFFKDFVCKHLLGIAIRLKYAEPVPKAKLIPIGQKRKRGRPKLATRALLVD